MSQNPFVQRAVSSPRPKIANICKNIYVYIFTFLCPTAHREANNANTTCHVQRKRAAAEPFGDVLHQHSAGRAPIREHDLKHGEEGAGEGAIEAKHLLFRNRGAILDPPLWHPSHLHTTNINHSRTTVSHSRTSWQKCRQLNPSMGARDGGWATHQCSTLSLGVRLIMLP